jgi:hypothetical protein
MPTACRVVAHEVAASAAAAGRRLIAGFGTNVCALARFLRAGAQAIFASLAGGRFEQPSTSWATTFRSSINFPF